VSGSSRGSLTYSCVRRSARPPARLLGMACQDLAVQQIHSVNRHARRPPVGLRPERQDLRAAPEGRRGNGRRAAILREFVVRKKHRGATENQRGSGARRVPVSRLGNEAQDGNRRLLRDLRHHPTQGGPVGRQTEKAAPLRAPARGEGPSTRTRRGSRAVALTRHCSQGNPTGGCCRTRRTGVRPS